MENLIDFEKRSMDKLSTHYLNNCNTHIFVWIILIFKKFFFGKRFVAKKKIRVKILKELSAANAFFIL